MLLSYWSRCPPARDITSADRGWHSPYINSFICSIQYLCGQLLSNEPGLLYGKKVVVAGSGKGEKGNKSPRTLPIPEVDQEVNLRERVTRGNHQLLPKPPPSSHSVGLVHLIQVDRRRKASCSRRGNGSSARFEKKKRG